MTASSSSRLPACDLDSRPFRRCGWCADGHLSRVARVSLTDHLLSFAGLLPFICVTCKRRTLRADFGHILLLSVCLPAILIVGMGFARRIGIHQNAPTPNPIPAAAEIPATVLTNEDVTRLVQANIPSTVMLRLIDGRQHRFRIDPDSLVRLKKDGVPDDVILTIVTVTLGQTETTRPDALRAQTGAVIATQAQK